MSKNPIHYLVNPDSTYYYSNQGKTLRIGNNLFWFFDSKNKRYWYADFMHGWDLETAKNDIPVSVVDKIKTGEIHLLLNNSHEAFHDVVEYVYKFFVKELAIPPKHILLLSESATIDQIVRKVASSYDKDPINVSWVRMFEQNISSYTDGRSKVLETLQLKEYTKKFLNLNRRWRLHRPVFVGLLKALDLIDQGHVSLAKVEGSNWNKVWSSIETSEIKNSEMYDLLTKNKQRIEDMGDLYLDTKKLGINQVDVNNKLDKYYLDTYFSIVSETNYYKNQGEEIFLSEKVFKPVLKNHPFIVVSRPGTLEKFRSLGYKSFHPYIKEEYDSEPDDQKRMMMILKEAERLCLISSDRDAFGYFLNGVSKIVEYNRNLLAYKRDKGHTAFVTELIK